MDNELSNCLNCGTPFKPHRKTQKYCSTKGKGVCKREYYQKQKQAEKLAQEEAEKEAVKPTV
ncbi:MAG: hypothetical protein GY810_05570, partial [Aureispira sp.]|nr:hypothetical protein [Aureispira sp.]